MTKTIQETATDIWINALSYVGLKQIDAMVMTLGDYNLHRGWTIPVDEDPAAPGYIVKYPDGYISWSPKEQFQLAYMTNGSFSYSAALYMLKCGHKLARAGWNGKNMWITMTPSKILDMAVDDIWTGNVKDMAIANGGQVEILPYLSMKTADNKLQIGWLASQSDMLSDDWCTVD